MSLSIILQYNTIQILYSLRITTALVLYLDMGILNDRKKNVSTLTVPGAFPLVCLLPWKPVDMQWNGTVNVWKILAGYI